MPIIKSISDLRNRAHEIAELCHTSGEPVFITKNGQGDLVVMSQALYEQRQALLELYKKLDEADIDALEGDRGISHARMLATLRRRLR
jgi:prevent-host-death family protein